VAGLGRITLIGGGFSVALPSSGGISGHGT
jgi:hypothetical protein